MCVPKPGSGMRCGFLKPGFLDTEKTGLYTTDLFFFTDLRVTLQDAISPTIPASILRDHPDATLVIDDAAASKLDADLKSKLESGV